MGAAQVSRTPTRDAPRLRCSIEGCPASVADHYWGKVKAIGWFFMRDGTAYCPEHLPEWLAEWRAGK